MPDAAWKNYLVFFAASIERVPFLRKSNKRQFAHESMGSFLYWSYIWELLTECYQTNHDMNNSAEGTEIKFSKKKKKAYRLMEWRVWEMIKVEQFRARVEQQQTYLSTHHKVCHSVSLKITQRQEGARAAAFQSSQNSSESTKKTKRLNFPKTTSWLIKMGWNNEEEMAS